MFLVETTLLCDQLQNMLNLTAFQRQMWDHALPLNLPYCQREETDNHFDWYKQQIRRFHFKLSSQFPER